MKITKPFVVIVTLICMSFMYVAVAQRVQPGPSISPRPDLTGATYCLFGQGTWLSAGNGTGNVTANPFAATLNFTSSTQLTVTPIYDPIGTIDIPSLTVVVEEDTGGDAGTYTVVGNLLTLTFLDNGESETSRFIMTPDAHTFVGGFFEQSGDSGVDIWETGMIVGVHASNCDGLIGE
jgi:hypothetical protein